MFCCKKIFFEVLKITLLKVIVICRKIMKYFKKDLIQTVGLLYFFISITVCSGDIFFFKKSSENEKKNALKAFFFFFCVPRP